MVENVKPLNFPGIGPVFEDTGRLKDLLYEAAELLKECMRLNPLRENSKEFFENEYDLFKSQIDEARSLVNYEDEPFESKEELKKAKILQDSLIDSINWFCPPYVNFGILPHNKSYGFYPDLQLLGEDLQLPPSERWVISLDAGEPFPPPEQLLKDGIDFVVTVNDHGNLTLYDYKGNELWSCV